MKTAQIILFILFVLTFCSCKTTETNHSDQVISIHVAQAQPASSPAPQAFPFISKPFRSSELSFRVGGPIEQLEVYAGNYYKQGDIIAAIDPRDFHIREERTQAVYQQAKTEFERTAALHQKNNISASTFEKAHADYITAKTAYETAVNEVKDTRLLAPFNGYVGEVYIEKFQDVKASQPVISLIDIEKLKIEAYVPQNIALNVHRSDTVHLEFDTQSNKIYQAFITEISKSTTSNNLSYLLTALLPNPGGQLPAGMSGKLFLQSSDLILGDPLIVVPQTAICHRPTEGDYVWVVNTLNQQVSKRPVILGDLQPGGEVIIREGLKVNETVATSGLRFLSDGMTVKIVSDQSPVH